jgi:hypothetical protein
MSRSRPFEFYQKPPRWMFFYFYIMMKTDLSFQLLCFIKKFIAFLSSLFLFC